MKISKNACVEAKNAIVMLNKQFSPQPVYSKPVKNIKFHDNFSRTLSEPDCKVANILSGYSYKESISADYYASESLGTDFITDDKIKFVIDYIKKTLIYDKKKSGCLKYLYNKENQGTMLASLNNFMTQARKAEFMKLGIQPQKGKFFNLEKLQAYSEMTCKLNKKTLALKRLFNEESKNPKVVQIEKELVEKYGIKRACLNDDLNQAEAVLEAVKTVKANGYPLADEYLVTKFCGGTLGEFMRIDNENIVILSSSEYVNSLKKFHDFYHQHLLGSFLERMHYSKNAGLESKVNELDEFFKNNKTPGSDSLLWTAVHETLHIGERSFLPTRTRKVPKEFIPAAMNTTRYAYLSNTQELFTELLSDKLINKNLSPEKEALLKFFNNGDR